MNILVIPTTDWVRHPVPNRLNFIFDIISERHEVHVLHFRLKRFKGKDSRSTRCKLVDAGGLQVDDPSLYYLLNAPRHLLRIREVVRREGIDVIVSANILPSLGANFAGSPVVFDYLDHLEESASVYYPGTLFGSLVKKGVSLISRYNIRHASSVITVTDEFKEFLRGVGANDVNVIPNGVDSSLLRPMPKEAAKAKLGLRGDVLGYVGSLEHWVDLESVIEALPRLDATLLIIGPRLFTDYEEKLKEMTERLGVTEKVIFKGAVRYSDLSVYISAMDIGLNPLKNMKKNQQTVGGKVFNYLACGRPVLSSRMRALETLLGDELYFYDDPESFIDQVRRIMASEDREARHRAVAEMYDWRKIAEDYEEVLRSVV